MNHNESMKKGNRSGFKKKPWWIFVIGLYLFCVPTINFFRVLAHGQDSNWLSFHSIIAAAEKIPPITWGLIIFTTISGAMLLVVRQFTWIFALSILLILTSYNFYAVHKFTLPPVLLFISILFSPFRRPYLDPSIRWWEQLPRYQTNIVGKILDLGSTIKVLNVSKSGLYFELAGGEEPSIDQQFLKLMLTNDLQIECEIARRYEKFFGVRFVNVSKTQKRAISEQIKTIAKNEMALNR